LARYPERESVETQVADFLGIDPGQVLLTNGVDEGIHLVCETYLEPGDEALIAVPTFSLYEIYAGATGTQAVTVPMAADFEFPVNNILSRVNPRTRFIAIANPNNPTGKVVKREDLLRIAAAAPQAAVLVDEAYFEFYGQTVLDAIVTTPNLFVARTFSKAYGLAGLRIGVLAGAPEQMKMVRRVSSPYNVNAAALACLPAALADGTYVAKYVSEGRSGRERLYAELEKLGLEHWKSEANFVLARIGEASGRFVAAMRERGILVRDRSGDPGCQGCVRMTLGSAEHTERLVVALRAVMTGLRSAGARA
jgi:histidinol-phosphate aminotransferase